MNDSELFMKEIDRERGDFGLESYLEEVRQEGGKVEQAEASGLTVVKAIEHLIYDPHFIDPYFSDSYVALRDGRVMAGKRIIYDKERTLETIQCFELSDVLTTHQLAPYFSSIHSQIRNLDIDHFYTHSGGFSSLFHERPYEGMLVSIGYVQRKNGPDSVPVELMIRHDAMNLLTGNPEDNLLTVYLEERGTGFRNLVFRAVFKGIGLSFPELLPEIDGLKHFEIDGVKYSIAFVEDDNAFTVVQDRGDAGKVMAGGFLAISQAKYDSLKEALMSDKVWGRDLSMLTPLLYSVQSSMPKQGNSAQISS